MVVVLISLSYRLFHHKVSKFILRASAHLSRVWIVSISEVKYVIQMTLQMLNLFD